MIFYYNKKGLVKMVSAVDQDMPGYSKLVKTLTPAQKVKLRKNPYLRVENGKLKLVERKDNSYEEREMRELKAKFLKEREEGNIQLSTIKDIIYRLIN